jgi:hypothetical protein
MNADVYASAFSFPRCDDEQGDVLMTFGSKTALKIDVHDKNHSECEFA